MLIRIKYYDNKYDMVKPWLLDKLIESGYIKAFYRKSGWVVIGKDEIRRFGGNYKGVERRQKENVKQKVILFTYMTILTSIEYCF